MRARLLPQLILAIIALLCAQAYAGPRGRGGPPAGAGAAPTISSIIPSNGSLNGGTFVTITGTGFSGALCANVTVGGTAVGSCTIASSTSITATTPSGSAGAVNVVVTTAGGTGTLSNGYTYAGLSALSVAGTNDPNGTALYGTETRQIVSHIVPNGGCLQPGTSGGGAGCSFHNPACSVAAGCPVVFIGTGDWEDSVCAGNPQVDILASSLGSVYVDNNSMTNPGGSCSGGVFPVVNWLGDGTFDFDENGSPISPAVDIAIAAGPNAATVFARNDNTGAWVSPSVGGSGAGTDRSGAVYDDNSNSKHISYLILGADGSGTRNGNPHNMTFQGWSGGGCAGAASCFIDGVDEAFVPNNGGSTCVTGQEGFTACTNLQAQFPAGTTLPNLALRFMSIVKCPVSNAGVMPVVYNLFLSVGVQVWKRTDNDANSTWSLFSQVTNQTDLSASGVSSTNGIRGLACVATPNTVTHPSGYVLQGNLQISSIMYQFDTQTGCTGSPACSNTVNLSTILASTWTSGNSKTRISAYNGGESPVYTDPVSGNQWSVFGEGNQTAGNQTVRPYITLSGTEVNALSGIWWDSLSSPSTATLYPSNPGTTASPPNFLNPSAGGVSAAFAAAACTNAGGVNCSGMISTRTLICSPFAEDGATSANGYCGQTLFFGGVDMQGSPASVSNVAWLLRLPVDATVHP